MPARLSGTQCAFPACIRPPHTAGLCWPHFQGARPFDEHDPVSVDLAIDRLAPDPLAALDVATPWVMEPIPDWVWERNADLLADRDDDPEGLAKP